MSTPVPQPGQIWEVRRSLYLPLGEMTQPIYSAISQSFLQGETDDRYVLIVTEPAQSIVTVMVLSNQTQYMSDVDVLIPSTLSGLEQALLAETWHIQETLLEQLSRPVGRRLSRSHYDLLLTIAEAYKGLAIAPARSTVQQLGLDLGAQFHLAFHQAEEAWSDVLTVPLAAYQAHQKGMARAQQILAEALQLERELVQVPLSQWLKGIVAEGWQQFQVFWDTQPSLAIAARSQAEDVNPTAVDQVLQQLQTTVEPHQRKRLIKQLGDVGVGASAAIAQLVEILRSPHDDEIVWAAVESLWQLDPGNAAAGVRQVKLIDFGMQLANQSVALAVALVPQANQQVGVLLQVYPIGEAAFLPAQLKLVLLDPSGQPLREVISRQADVYIQLRLSGSPGEAFGVRLELANAQITEDFVI